MSDLLVASGMADKDNAWSRAKDYERESREMRQVRKIVVKGRGGRGVLPRPFGAAGGGW